MILEWKGDVIIAIYRSMMNNVQEVVLNSTRKAVLAILLTLVVAPGAALAKVGAPPKSQSLQLRDVDHIAKRDMDFVDVASLVAEDAERVDRLVPYRVAMLLPVQIGATAAGRTGDAELVRKWFVGRWAESNGDRL